jgi:hypothetical protein
MRAWACWRARAPLRGGARGAPHGLEPPARAAAASALWTAFDEGAHVYYVHSYRCEAGADVTIAESDYGGAFPRPWPVAGLSACSSIPRRARPWACG